MPGSGGRMAKAPGDSTSASYGCCVSVPDAERAVMRLAARSIATTCRRGLREGLWAGAGKGQGASEGGQVC